MYPMPLPPPPAIYFEISHQIPEMWRSFDSSYQALLDIANCLEQLEEIEGSISEDELKKIRTIVIHLIQIGSLNATASQLDLLNYDIALTCGCKKRSDLD